MRYASRKSGARRERWGLSGLRSLASDRDLCYISEMDDLTLPTRMPRISAEERARRKAAIDYARTTVRLEGFVQSDFAEELNRRYIDGEITSAEHSATILAHYSL